MSILQVGHRRIRRPIQKAPKTVLAPPLTSAKSVPRTVSVSFVAELGATTAGIVADRTPPAGTKAPVTGSFVRKSRGVASTTADEGKYDEMLVIEGFDPGKAKAFR